MQTETIRIERRFRGPPSSGNGGYVAGMVAKMMGGSGCAVTLRAPPPLDVPLELRSDDAGVLLLAGETLIAAGAPAEIDIAVPAPPDVKGAQSAQERFTGFDRHVFPGCFVCGPERGQGDGLRIFPGAAEDGAQVAAQWRPDEGLSDGEGRVRSEYLWAALDCPGYFAVQKISGPAVLGRLAVTLHRDVMAGDGMIVTGWPIGSDGRKHRAGTAIHDQDGRLCAAAEATWIQIASAEWEGKE